MAQAKRKNIMIIEYYKGALCDKSGSADFFKDNEDRKKQVTC
jgi:hypothetical protein